MSHESVDRCHGREFFSDLADSASQTPALRKKREGRVPHCVLDAAC